MRVDCGECDCKRVCVWTVESVIVRVYIVCKVSGRVLT